MERLAWRDITSHGPGATRSKPKLRLSVTLRVTPIAVLYVLRLRVSGDQCVDRRVAGMGRTRAGLAHVRVSVRLGLGFVFWLCVRVGVGGGRFLTLHSITYPTAVVICDHHSKGWLGSREGTFVTSEVEIGRHRQPTRQEHQHVSPGHYPDHPTWGGVHDMHVSPGHYPDHPTWGGGP